MHSYSIRDADLQDVATIIEFNRRLAVETEGKILNEQVLAEGVQAALSDSSKCRYFVAQAESGILGQLMITYEWSDWRNGWIWWLQSVYILEGHRGQGIFRNLYAHVEALARRQGNVVGIRLYVENNNAKAQEAYAKNGLAVAGYHVLEKFFAAS